MTIFPLALTSSTPPGDPGLEVESVLSVLSVFVGVRDLSLLVSLSISDDCRLLVVLDIGSGSTTVEVGDFSLVVPPIVSGDCKLLVTLGIAVSVLDGRVEVDGCGSCAFDASERFVSWLHEKEKLNCAELFGVFYL